MNLIRTWWEEHFQKTWSSLLILIDGVNLVALQAYHDDIVQFFGPQRGPTTFSGIRMALGILIFWRASRKKASS